MRLSTILIAAGVAMLAVTGAVSGVEYALEATQAPAEETAEAVEEAPEQEQVKEEKQGLEYWKSVNPDIIGVVQVPGTDIDQPIAMASADDPEYYLTHDAYGNQSLEGCPYLDAGCGHGMRSWNLVVTGHNISFPPGVFHDIEYYHNPEFAETHRDIVIETEDGVKQYEVVAVNTIDGSEEIKRIEFKNAQDFAKYRDERIAESNQVYGKARSAEQMLTLVSCSYFINPSNERTLVYAIEKDS